MGDARSGLGKVIADAGPLPLPEPAQTPDLFGGEAARGSPVDESAKALGVPTARVAGRRPGRPEGARNASTEQVVRFLSERYRHPLLGLADVASTPPEQLAKLISGSSYVTRDDRRFAWSLWLQCAKELAEYLTPKQPRAISLTEDSAPLLQMFFTGQAMPGVGASAPMFGFPENPMISEASQPIGGEVLDSEVLEQAKPVEKSNG